MGVRKVMGAERGALVRQFLGESMVLAFLALVIAFGLVAVLLPLFNQLTDKSLSAERCLSRAILLAFLGLALLTSILAGSYPAFYLSRVQPNARAPGSAYQFPVRHYAAPGAGRIPVRDVGWYWCWRRSSFRSRCAICATSRWASPRISRLRCPSAATNRGRLIQPSAVSLLQNNQVVSSRRDPILPRHR